MPRLVAHLLGTPRLYVDQQPFKPASTKALALACYLIASRQVHTRDRLAAFFWPEYPDRNALASLRTALYEIRRSLADAAPHFLEVDRHRVALAPGADAWVDVWVVDAVAAGEGEADAEGLQTAIEAYGGEFLSGLSLPDSCDFDDWLTLERERLAQRHLRHLCLMAEHAAGQGDYARAVELVRAVLAADPLREDVHRQLMDYYVRSGQRAAAVAVYRELCERLDRELGIQPLETTTRFYRRIEVGEPLEEPAPTPHPASRAAARMSAAAEDAFLSLRPQKLAARQRELAVLEAAWQAAEAGRGSLLVVSGEAGVGKSTLMAEFACRLADKAIIFVGRCHEATASQPFRPIIEALRTGMGSRLWSALEVPAPWRRLLGRLLPDLAARESEAVPVAADDQRERDRLFEAVWATVLAASAARPVLFVIDDAQWADETSLALLSYLGSQVTSCRCLIAVLCRTEELDAERRALVRRLVSSGRQLALGPLTVQETAELIGDLSSAARDPVRFARRIHRVTGGNPFFILETLRALIEQGSLQLEPAGWTTLADSEADDYACLPVPDSVAAIVDARLDRLSDDARLLAECASVLRRDFAFDLVLQLSGLPVRVALDGLDSLISQGLVQESAATPGCVEVRYDFSHSLVRDRVYGSMSGARRQHLHRQVAGMLEAAPGAPPDRVAYHYLHGGVRERAVHWALRAGAAALALHGGEAALRHFGTARELATQEQEERRALTGIGDAYVSLGRLREAVLAYEQALRLPAGDTDQADLCRRIGRAHERQGAYDKALAAYGRARKLLAGQASLCALQVADGLATVYVRLGRHAQAIGLCLDALAWLAENPDFPEVRRAEAWIQNTLGMAYLHDGDYEPAERALSRSLELKRALADRQGEATLLNNLGALCYHRGEDERARGYYEASLRIKEEIGDSYGRAIALTNLALMETHLGNYESARRLLEAAEAAVGVMGARWLVPEIRRVAAQRALAVGDAATALAAAEAGLAAAEDLGVPAFIGAAHRIMGSVKALACGDPVAAREHFETSMAVFEMLANEHELAKTQAAFGEVLQATGDPETAERLLRDAAAVFERSGAHGRRRRLDALLSR